MLTVLLAFKFVSFLRVSSAKTLKTDLADRQLSFHCRKTSVLPGRHFYNFSENAVKKLFILISHCPGDLPNPHITARQQLTALLYSDLLQILPKRQPCILPEYSADIRQCIMILPAEHSQVNIILIISVNVLNHFQNCSVFWMPGFLMNAFS